MRTWWLIDWYSSTGVIIPNLALKGRIRNLPTIVLANCIRKVASLEKSLLSLFFRDLKAARMKLKVDVVLARHQQLIYARSSASKMENGILKVQTHS